MDRKAPCLKKEPIGDIIEPLKDWYYQMNVGIGY